MWRSIISIVALSSVACALREKQEASDLLSLVANNPDLSIFYEAVQKAGVGPLLQSKQATTVFAPTNEAFGTEPMSSFKLKYLLDGANKKTLEMLVKYHIGTSVETVADLTRLAAFQVGVETVLKTSQLFPIVAAGKLEIDDETCSRAAVVGADIQASNGILQIVDRVFVPAGAFCPDVIFAAEQRSDSRISAYGFDCRNKGFQHLVHGEDKPVGLAVDSASQTLFWSNDADSPHGAPNSWITAMNFSDVSTMHKIKSNVVDPQGMEADTANKKLYFTEHSGHRVSRMDYNGSNVEVLAEKKGDDCFQPSDVSADVEANKVFFYAECPASDQGTLWVMNTTGGNLTKIKGSLVHNYGLCLDKPNRQLFYVQGGNGGSVSCLAYGNTPCTKETVIDGLLWPYMCQIDSTWAKFGGPTLLIFSEANRPGTISYLNTNGTGRKSLKVLTSELDAPMGLALGCIGSAAGMNVTYH